MKSDRRENEGRKGTKNMDTEMGLECREIQ